MSSPCPRHPSHPLVGVCASCLREKLGTFVDEEEEEEEEEEGGGGLGGDNGSFGSSPIVKKAIDNGSYVHDSPTKMAASVASNELQAPAMESNTCPQVGFPSLTRSLSFNEISAKLSPISTAQKRTLSYYLDLYNEGGESSALNSHKTTISSKRVNHHSPLCASYNAAYGGNEEKKHGSLSSTGLRNPMIVGCESGTPLSWLSALFSRRREKQEAKSRQAFASWRGCSSGGGCEGAYESSSSISWEAPSCREQLSSWENPTPSSWQLPSIQNSHPTRAYEAAAHNPTIASQKEELNQRIGHGFAAETKPKPHWNEVWTKTLLSNKWAIKLKSGLNKKSQQPGADSDDHRRASTMSAASSSASNQHHSQNQNSVQNHSSSSASHQHHSQNQNSVQNHSWRTQQNSMSKGQMKTSQDEAHQYRQREFGSSRRDYGAWDFYYGPVHSTSFESNHKSNSARSGDSGLLRFYLTPVRGTGFRGKGKQSAHHH